MVQITHGGGTFKNVVCFRQPPTQFKTLNLLTNYQDRFECKFITVSHQAKIILTRLYYRVRPMLSVSQVQLHWLCQALLLTMCVFNTYRFSTIQSDICIYPQSAGTSLGVNVSLINNKYACGFTDYLHYPDRLLRCWGFTCHTHR